MMKIRHFIRSAFGSLCLSVSMLAGDFRRNPSPKVREEEPVSPPPPTIPYSPPLRVRRLVSRDIEALNKARNKRDRKAQKRIRDAEACGK